MKKINNKIKTYSLDEVFKRDLKSNGFKKMYNEELARLKLAKQIREIRLQGRMTQGDIALKTKMPQSVIARIESGTHSYSLGTLYRIASVFNKEIRLV